MTNLFGTPRTSISTISSDKVKNRIYIFEVGMGEQEKYGLSRNQQDLNSRVYFPWGRAKAENFFIGSSALYFAT